MAQWGGMLTHPDTAGMCKHGTRGAGQFGLWHSVTQDFLPDAVEDTVERLVGLLLTGRGLVGLLRLLPGWGGGGLFLLPLYGDEGLGGGAVCAGEAEDDFGLGGIVGIVDDFQEPGGDEVGEDGVYASAVGEGDSGGVYELDLESDLPGITIEGGITDSLLGELEQRECLPVGGRISVGDRTVELPSE